MSADAILKLSAWVLPVLLAVTLHEAAHGWVAWKLGDDTAWRMGRVTFNPLKHIDPFGTIILPALLLFASAGQMMFGAAKPVPVNFRALGHPRRDMALVALAGPASNLAMAAAAALALHVTPLLSGVAQQWVGLNLLNAIWINLLLCVFNMLPLPPLDGGRVAVAVLPHALGSPLARLERAGIAIILILIFVPPWIGRSLGMDLNVFWWLIGGPAQAMMRFLGTLTGIHLA